MRVGLGAVAGWFLLVVLSTAMHTAGAAKPKLAADAVSVQKWHAYLQSHPAPDYWALSPFYEAQFTSSACSVAAIAMVLNALRGLPASDDARLITQASLLQTVARRDWTEQTAEQGRGVTFNELQAYVDASLAAFHVQADLDVFEPQNDGPDSVASMRGVLVENEKTDQDIVLVYFNQGVLTGSWDGPHISPVAAYDTAYRRVLIMDVDREWYIPYWVPDDKLLAAMLRPTPAGFGALAGGRGGLVRTVLRGSRGH